MFESKFKAMRHVETVRNFISTVIKELLNRQELHDQTKLQSPEAEIFAEHTPKLRDSAYASEEYNECLKEMNVALEHHYKNSRHHPEHFGHMRCAACMDTYTIDPDAHCVDCSRNGIPKHSILSMNLIDMIEMLCDWKAATLRHDTGDLYQSIELNQKRFGYGNEIKKLLINTAKWLDEQDTFHHAKES